MNGYGSVSEVYMKYNATVGLTSAYLQKLGRQNNFATGVAVLVVTISLFWMLFHVGGDRTVGLFSDSICTLGLLMGATLAWTTCYRARRGALELEPRYQLTWLLIGLGLFADSLGRAYFDYLEYNGQLNPTPTYADIGFTLFFPLVFAGLILIFTDPKPDRVCVRMGLDSLITTLCILGVNWYFFIDPIFLLQSQAHVTMARLVSTLSYPFWDVLLILAIVLIIRRCAERIMHPSLLLCAMGLFTVIWADMARSHFTALGTYHSGTFYIDSFWLIGALLIGLSALYQYTALAHRAFSERTHPSRCVINHAPTSNEYAPPGHNKISARRSIFLQIALIFFPLGILLALTLGSEVIDDKGRALFLLLLTALVGIVVAVRYLLTAYDNELCLEERE